MSRATVSYVLNNTPNGGIPEHTSEKIRKIAEELNYIPSAAAKALRSGTSNLVLGVLPSWDLGPTYPQIFSRMGEQLNAMGYGFVLQSLRNNNFDLEELLKHLSPCLIVTLQDITDTQKRALKSAGIPHRLIDLGAFVALAGSTQVQYLYKRNFTRMLYVLPDHFLPEILISPRIAAMEKTAFDLGIAPPKTIRLPYTAEGIAEFELEYLMGDNAVNGICAYTDEVASFIYTMLGIERFGAGRIGLVGVGNRPISNIGLTTVRLDIENWANTWMIPVLDALEKKAVHPIPVSEQSMGVEKRHSA